MDWAKKWKEIAGCYKFRADAYANMLEDQLERVEELGHERDDMLDKVCDLEDEIAYLTDGDV